MATDDQQILVTGTSPTPAQFTISGHGQIRPKEIFASFNGTGAGTPYVPALKIISDGGKTVGIHPADVNVAAGASADVTWFRGLRKPCPPPAPSPNPLGTVWAWYDFSDTTTITLDGGGKIVAITDKTGNGHDLAQANAGNRPTESTLNALNCGNFDNASSQDVLGGPWSDTLPQPFTILSVFTQTIAGGGNYFPGPIGGGPTPAPAIFFFSAAINRLFMEQGIASINSGVAGPITQRLVTGIFNGAASSIRVDGVQTNGAVDVGTVTNIALGTAHDPNVPGTDSFLHGKIGEVLYYTTALSASQLLAVEAYLKAKWNTP